MRAAFTLLELVVVLMVVAILTGLSVPRLSSMVNANSVQAAVFDVRESIEIGRYAALSKSEMVRVVFDPSTATVRVVSPTDTLLTRNLAQVHGVTMRASNRTITFNQIGIGYGASNSSIVLTRGNACDTVVVSRVGRVRS